MSVELLTEHHLELLSFKGDNTGSSESTLVKMLSCRGSYRSQRKVRLKQACSVIQKLV